MLTKITNPQIEIVFDNYPDFVKKQMFQLRNLIIAVAEETPAILELEETLKWGEPSFITPQGSTLRINWKPKTPNQYALYFKCTSKLVSTFKIIFDNQFQYEGSRAIVFPLDYNLPIPQVKACIKAALMYHQVKHLHSLGI